MYINLIMYFDKLNELTSIKKHKLELIILLPIAMILVSCLPNVKEIGSDELNTKIMESINHSSRSWWVVDEDDASYILIEKTPLSKNYYRVRKKEVKINVNKYPTNLKYDNIQFLRTE